MNIAAPLQLHQAERALRDFPGRTVAELAEAIGAERTILRERLLDLEQLGKAHRRGFNTCAVTGKPSAGWHAGPVGAEEELPRELVNQYANALDAMSVPVDPRTAPEPARLECAHPIPLYLPATEADTNEA